MWENVLKKVIEKWKNRANLTEKWEQHLYNAIDDPRLTIPATYLLDRKEDLLML